ncbi:MAG: hypothetical protein R3195_03725 [Gemmatimonadota bacterium]|nr:hypothetical protein [Gemmatimonadota bacterium]
MYTVTPVRVGIVLALYALIFLVFLTYRRAIASDERKTFAFVGFVWAVSVFIGNYVFFRIGLMSFLPWLTNFMHTFLWIGFCLTWLYLGVRDTQPAVLQFALFFFFSLVVKGAETAAFGTWEHDRFFWVIPGNHWYILGWSLLDGLYPLITRTGLRFIADRGWVHGLKTS